MEYAVGGSSNRYFDTVVSTFWAFYPPIQHTFSLTLIELVLEAESQREAGFGVFEVSGYVHLSTLILLKGTSELSMLVFVAIPELLLCFLNPTSHLALRIRHFPSCISLRSSIGTLFLSFSSSSSSSSQIIVHSKTSPGTKRVVHSYHK